MDNLFSDIGRLDSERLSLEQINRLQDAFNDVKKSYDYKYEEDLNSVIKSMRQRLQSNQMICDTVNNYIQKYVSSDKQDNAKEELYNILSAEMLQTLVALSHTSCIIS